MKRSALVAAGALGAVALLAALPIRRSDGRPPPSVAYPIVSAGHIQNSAFAGTATVSASATACHCTARDAACTQCSLSGTTLSVMSSGVNDVITYTCYSGVP